MKWVKKRNQLHTLLGDHSAGEQRMYAALHESEDMGDLNEQNCSVRAASTLRFLGVSTYSRTAYVRSNRQGGTDDGRETRLPQHFRRVLHDTPVAFGLLRLHGGLHTN